MKGFLVASAIALAVSAPGVAHASPVEDAEGCTTVLVERITSERLPQFGGEPDLVVIDDDGTIHIYPQNAGPLADHLVGYALAVADPATDYVACVV